MVVVLCGSLQLDNKTGLVTVKHLDSNNCCLLAFKVCAVLINLLKWIQIRKNRQRGESLIIFDILSFSLSNAIFAISINTLISIPR